MLIYIRKISNFKSNQLLELQDGQHGQYRDESRTATHSRPNFRVSVPRNFGVCREVSEDCNSWIERFCVVNFLLDFGDKRVNTIDIFDGWYFNDDAPVEAIVPGWKRGVKKFAHEASLDDLLELKEIISSDVWKYETPVHYAARNDKQRVMQFFLYTDYDFNDGCTYHFYHFGPPFVLACSHGSLDVAKMMIESSKEFGSDHIDLNANDKDGETALDVVKSKIRFGDPGKREIYNRLKTLLEEEYTENPENDQSRV